MSKLNTDDVTVKTITANGSIGTAGQLLTANGTGSYWSPPSFAGNVSIGDVLSFNSGYGSAAKAYGCRAWVNFNGTGTVAIRASGGVTSVTDSGTGTYTLNFENNFPDADYAVSIAIGGVSGGAIGARSAEEIAARTVSTFRFNCFNSAFTSIDSPYINVAVFR